jgi:endogenous inhibitor of DNA gyrase (YacG/DUF329 family)
MTKIKCPQCSKETQFEGNEYRPFCSERCKLLDFGAWVDEEYNLPAESQTLSEEELVEMEKAALKEGRN